MAKKQKTQHNLVTSKKFLDFNNNGISVSFIDDFDRYYYIVAMSYHRSTADQPKPWLIVVHEYRTIVHVQYQWPYRCRKMTCCGPELYTRTDNQTDKGTGHNHTYKQPRWPTQNV